MDEWMKFGFVLYNFKGESFYKASIHEFTVMCRVLFRLSKTLTGFIGNSFLRKCKHQNAVRFLLSCVGAMLPPFTLQQGLFHQ
jgi:hypothetical protein